MNPFNLQGQVAAVTGGFTGLGRHFATTLALLGVSVALLSRRIELGREVAQSIQTQASSRILAIAFINIASILGLRVREQVASYAARKAGIVHLTHALALEWAH